MREAWRVVDVRAAEEALMGTVADGVLMQRAAAGLAGRCAGLLADRYGRLPGRRVVLLVGAGNNGGDALYAGARLARRGAAVTALLLAPDRAHAAGLADLRAAGGTVRPAHADAGTGSRNANGTGNESGGGSRNANGTGNGSGGGSGPPDGGRSRPVDLVMDGIVGIGAQGGLRPAAARLVREVTSRVASDGGRPIVVAVDAPSGIDVDTGHVPGEAVRADVTVTFGCLKPGLLVGAAAPLAGLVELVDIGLRPWLRTDPAVRVADLLDVAGWWPRPGPDSNKYTRGVVGLATGSARYSGAAVLSVAGAQAGPAGMIRYAGSAATYVRHAHPSAVVADRVADAGRVQAWVCGSGLGSGRRAADDLRGVLAAPVPACLDADALTMLVDGSMAGWLRGRVADTVLTPHDGEFARLAGSPPGADRVEAALQLAVRTNAVVLLKGDRTVVATPAGRAWANPTGTPYLATAGSGDVLAGLLGSLLAAGLSGERAAVAAAYAHGLAGRHAALSGPVTAEDVAAALRPVVGSLPS